MDCLTELGKEAVTKLGELAVVSTIKHFKYLTQHKKITTNLEEEFKNLKMMKQALQTRVDIDERKGYEIEPIVAKWLSDVTTTENDWQKWITDNKNKNKKCFGGQCSNLTFNYSLGKQATKNIKHITSLMEEKNKFKDISHPKASLTLGSTFTKDIKSLMSREKLITQVIEKLKDDQVKMISICGMGGVGKTTLVKELIKVVEKSKLFDEVAMAVVSQDINYEKIQIQVAEGLGMEMKNVSQKGRETQLLERLSKGKKVLIVLDDVWEILEFECIGLPNVEHHKHCKILFTSREANVCQNMGCKVNFPVSVLDKDEAWYLFREMAGEIVDRPDINPIARDVANECGGLPLAVVTVGRALNNKRMSAWEDALRQLRNFQSSSSFLDVEKFVFSSIELSLKFLGSREHTHFLMLCGLFPEDFDIPIESLLHHAIGMGLFKDISVSWKARNRVHTLVGDLKGKFLLLDSNVAGCVKLHDIVRNVVLSIASKNAKDKYMVKYNIKSLKEEELNNINAISLILDDTNELENGLECPTLKLLQVRSKSKEPIVWPELFFQGMSVLKVLSMQNLCIPKVPSLSQASVNLHTLQLEHCDVGDISVIGKELIHLEVLSFAHSNVKELPIEIGNLNILRLLDLTNCNYLNVISGNVFIRLARLEELYFQVDNFPWKRNDAAINELKRISHQLKVVEMKVRDTETLVKDLEFNNIHKFWIYVNPYPYCNLRRSEYLESNLLQIDITDYQSIKSMLMISQLIKKCEILAIRKVKKLKNVASQLFHDAPYLKDLRVNSCPDLKYLIDGTVHCNDFPQIHSLSLIDLPNLTEMFYTPDHHEVKGMMIDFSYLVKLELVDLPSFIGLNNAMHLNELNQELSVATKLSDSTNNEDGEKLLSAKLFSSNWMKQFPKLETILLKGCSSFEVVFDLEGYLKSNVQEQDLLFPQLTKIEISNLKNLSYVWGIVPRFVQGFQNVRFLTISDCDSLKHVFTSAIVRAITNLEKLEVRSCALIENIVVWSRDEEDDNNEQDTTTISFNKLHHLSLSRLPKLVSICSDSLWLDCPSLMKFEVDVCPMLEIYFIPTHNDAKHDKLNIMNSTNTKNVGLQSSKENNSRSSSWSSVGCMPCIPKFIHQGNTSKKNSKEASVTQEIHNHIPFVFEMKNKKGKSYMPTLEDLCIVKCDLLDALFFPDEECNFTILSHMKTIKIEKCDKLKTIIVRRGKREDMINSLALLESLQLINLPNLLKLCYFETYESWDKQQYMDESVGDNLSIRHHTLIDEILFPNITSLVIDACNKIKILFSHSSLSGLKHLKELKVIRCEEMEEIISHEEEMEASANKISIPALQHLLLLYLPNLKAFFKGDSNLDFPSLQNVEIRDCSNIELFSRGLSNTPELEDLTIENNSLIYYCAQKKDINVVVQGFKTFVASQGFKMLNWTKQHNERYFIRNSKIYIHEFHKLLKLTPDNEIHMLQHVRELKLSNCDSLVEVFGSGGEDMKEGDDTTHYQLENIQLYYLSKLSHIWKHNITKSVSFQNLKDISVYTCHKLKNLLSHSMAKSLVQLKKVEVENCKMMEEIITKGEELYVEGGNKVKTLFPKLEELILLDLPMLECVCSGNYDYDIPLSTVEMEEEFNNNDKVQISFPELRELKFRKVPRLKCFCPGVYNYDINLLSTEVCPNMRTFPYGNVIVNAPNLHKLQWDSVFIDIPEDLNLTIYYRQNSEKYKAELQKLETFKDADEELLGYIKKVTELDIINCHKLLNCIPSSMMHLFSHVEYLTVKECDCLEEIFESNDNMLQCELIALNLYSLPKLKHIWKNHGQNLGFKYLYGITIDNCNDLEHVLPDVSMVTILQNLRYLYVRKCKNMKEIIGNNSCVQPNAKIKFPDLSYIELKKLPSLKCFSRSSFPCYLEMPQCYKINIEDCPEMKTFWYDGTLYTPRLVYLYVNETIFDRDEDVNEVIQGRFK